MAPDALEPAVAAARLAELWPGGPALLVGPGAASAGRRDRRGAASIIARAPIPSPWRGWPRPPPRNRPTGPRPLYLRGADARTIAERAAAARA